MYLIWRTDNHFKFINSSNKIYKMMSPFNYHGYLNPITEEHLHMEPDRDLVKAYGRMFN